MDHKSFKRHFPAEYEYRKNQAPKAGTDAHSRTHWASKSPVAAVLEVLWSFAQKMGSAPDFVGQPIDLLGKPGFLGKAPGPPPDPPGPPGPLSRCDFALHLGHARSASARAPVSARRRALRPRGHTAVGRGRGRRAGGTRARTSATESSPPGSPRGRPCNISSADASGASHGSGGSTG